MSKDISQTQHDAAVAAAMANDENNIYQQDETDSDEADGDNIETKEGLEDQHINMPSTSITMEVDVSPDPDAVTNAETNESALDTSSKDIGIVEINRTVFDQATMDHEQMAESAYALHGTD